MRAEAKSSKLVERIRPEKAVVDVFVIISACTNPLVLFAGAAVSPDEKEPGKARGVNDRKCREEMMFVISL
jgi:hypothetical protein